jgi:tRNA (guanine37-N1)-methyltransferase
MSIRKETAYSLRVPKRLGEEAIRLVSSLGLLHRDLKVEPEDEYLHIPLIRMPASSEAEEIRRTLGCYEISIREFPRRFRVIRSAFDIAAEKLLPHLLASFPRAIDLIGEVAIVEIPPELEGHKKIIGESILQAHKRVKTVLAKSSAITGVRRLREYEVIAGSGMTETIHREHGCIYHLDVRKVYFSPRLSFEHKRVASQVGENETIIDMFAGVGPFSILIAKMHRNVKVYAIDLNPDAVRYLERNIIANRVSYKVMSIHGDARKVIRERLRGVADRVIMNLPEKAFEYLDAACEAIKPEGGILHYYCFMRGDDPIQTAEKELADGLEENGRGLDQILHARKVREVAPGKWQIVIDARIR